MNVTQNSICVTITQGGGNDMVQACFLNSAIGGVGNVNNSHGLRQENMFLLEKPWHGLRDQQWEIYS